MEQSISNYEGMMNRSSLLNDVRKFTLTLYENPMTPRSEVDRIVGLTSKFISESYVPFLQKEMKRNLEKFVSIDSLGKINVILEENKTVFDGFKSEHLRFKEYEKECMFFKPEKFVIGKHAVTGESLHAVHVSLKKTLKIFLELPGMFESIKNYMEILTQNTQNTVDGANHVISNIIQADLWKKKYSNECIGRNVIPCIVFCDEIETGNSMGSHGGEEELAMVYVSIPVLEPHLVAKLTNIFLSTIYYSKDKKHCKNEEIFKMLNNELTELGVNGLNISVKGVEEKVFFYCVLIAGDNKGQNEICGFKSFSARYYCRICRVTSDECKVLCKEDVQRLRTRESYAMDVGSGDGGVREECVFNKLPKYSITENRSLDVMHDVLEGPAKDVIELVLTIFILILKLFTLEEFNERLRNFDFGVENSHRPRPLSVEKCAEIDQEAFKGKSKIRAKQSAAEMATLVRYLGLLLDDWIPEKNEYWLLYVLLRKIIAIVLAPRFTKADLYQLKDIIEQFDAKFLKLYKRLKPKPHLWLHMPLVMKDNGPLPHFWAMTFERKHRTYKSIADGTSSSRDLAMTLAIKNQLLLSCRKEKFISVDKDYELGPEKTHETKALFQVQRLITDIKSYKFYKHITLMGHRFTERTIFVDGINENDDLTFVQLKHVVDVNGKLYLHVCSLVTKYFNDHYHAYQVTINNIPNKLIALADINRMPPCLLFKNANDEYYVACRYD